MDNLSINMKSAIELSETSSYMLYIIQINISYKLQNLSKVYVDNLEELVIRRTEDIVQQPYQSVVETMKYFTDVQSLLFSNKYNLILLKEAALDDNEKKEADRLIVLLEKSIVDLEKVVTDYGVAVTAESVKIYESLSKICLDDVKLEKKIRNEVKLSFEDPLVDLVFGTFIRNMFNHLSRLRRPHNLKLLKMLKEECELEKEAIKNKIEVAVQYNLCNKPILIEVEKSLVNTIVLIEYYIHK